MTTAADAIAETDVFASLVGALLPEGGDVLTLNETYFDESEGAAGGRRILCVAGYIMTDRMARRLSREWKAVLNEYRLEYFRMSACAHGNHPFDKLTKDERIAVETKMIALIKRRTIEGLAVSVDPDEFDRHMIKSPIIGGAYSFCVHVIIGGIINWIERTGFNGKVAYFFEAGHKHQGEAEGIMRRVFTDRGLKGGTRYAAHSFVDKKESRPVQAAGLLAWQWYTDLRHQIEGRKSRADCLSLLKHPHRAVHITPQKMVEIQDNWAAKFDLMAESSLASLLLGERGDG